MNNTLNLHRIQLLLRQYFLLNGKKLIISLGAAAGIIFVINALLFGYNYDWLNDEQVPLFFTVVGLFTMAGAAIIWTGEAFPGFRSKYGTFNYLNIPASNIEKMLVEVIVRILLLILVFPLLYWMISNFAFLVMSVFPEFEYYSFTFNFDSEEFSRLDYTLFVSIGILISCIVFMGASYFKKLPSVKTVATFFVLASVYFAFVYLVIEKLGVKNYSKDDGSLLFLKNATDAKYAGMITATLFSILLIVISYLRLKEKEV